VCQPPNKQLQRTVERYRGDDTRASFHYARASRFARQRAAAEPRRIRLRAHIILSVEFQEHAAVYCAARRVTRCLGVAVADIAGHARVLSRSGSARSGLGSRRMGSR
jgi:hypothetical protein